MSDQRQSEPELRLLLEDYERPRNGRTSDPNEGPGFESPAPNLLLEDYPKRIDRWLADHPREPGEAPVRDDTPLHLLVEDFQPVERYREANSGPRKNVAVEPGPEPNFLIRWDDDIVDSRRREARAASAGLHLLVIIGALLQPYIAPHDFSEPENDHDYTEISLAAPSKEELRELTQPTPQQKGPAQTFTGIEQTITPLTTPDPEIAPPTPQAAPTQPVEPPPEPEPKLEPPQPEPEPEPEPVAPPPAPAASAPAPDEFQKGRQLATNRVEELPMPRTAAPPKEKPKLELEDPKATMPAPEGPIQIGEMQLNKRPDQLIESAIKNMAEAGGGRQAVGDGVAAGSPGGYVPPSPGNVGSGLELLSDPKGVDFRPYLLQVLNSVRRNWYAVIPESARLGMEKGRSAIQFSISRVGDVPKLVIASSSGSQPLDRAAVAGISASLPFPPLPAEYTGNEVRLQFVFLYNTR